MALNVSGDVQLDFGQARNALTNYREARVVAGSTKPSAAYQETAALVNIAQALMAAGYCDTRARAAVRDAEQACERHKFWQHLVVLRMAEVHHHLLDQSNDQLIAACHCLGVPSQLWSTSASTIEWMLPSEAAASTAPRGK